jgi:dissimilatory sulfite reductase (desulfoviridin) alpha/beta subunit
MKNKCGKMLTKIIFKPMKNKLTIIIGPKNSGKTLKAKEIALNYNSDEVVWTLQPLQYVSKMLNYWDAIIKPKTKLVVIDDIDDEIFLYSMMSLFKYKKLTKVKTDIVLVCDRNITEMKWVKIKILHNIDCEFIILP